MSQTSKLALSPPSAPTSEAQGWVACPAHDCQAELLAYGVCPFRHESLILPLLFANRGYAELEIALSHWKKGATTLPNRGEIQVVEAQRSFEFPSGDKGLKLIANRHTGLQSRRANSLKIQGGVCF